MILVEGAAGSGKSQLTRDMIRAGEAAIVADVTRLWVAAGQYERGPDGRYPVRLDADPALHTARFLKTAAVSFALREGYDVAITTSQRGQSGRWAAMAAEHGAPFEVRTLDLDESVVRERLRDPETGELDPSCEAAIGRWFT